MKLFNVNTAIFAILTLPVLATAVTFSGCDSADQQLFSARVLEATYYIKILKNTAYDQVAAMTAAKSDPHLLKAVAVFHGLTTYEKHFWMEIMDEITYNPPAITYACAQTTTALADLNTCVSDSTAPSITLANCILAAGAEKKLSEDT